MRTEYMHKPGRGSLFVQKTTKETQPKWKGRCVAPDGKVYDLAMWEQKTKQGELYLSMQMEVPRSDDDRDTPF